MSQIASVGGLSPDDAERRVGVRPGVSAHELAVIDENDTGRISVDELASFLRKSYRAAPTLQELQLLLEDYA